MKRILSIVLSVAVLVGVCSSNALAASPDLEESNFKCYVMQDGQEVTGNYITGAYATMVLEMNTDVDSDVWIWTLSSGQEAILYSKTVKKHKVSVTYVWDDNASDIGFKCVVRQNGDTVFSKTITYQVIPIIVQQEGRLVSATSGRATQMSVKWKNRYGSEYDNTADGAYIYYTNDSHFKNGIKTVKVSDPDQTSRKITGLSNNKTYYVAIKIFKKRGGKIYTSKLSRIQSVKVGMPKCVLSKVTSPKKKYLKAVWKKVSGCSGYQMQISLKSSFSGARAKSISKSKASYTVSGFKTKKKYFVRIRAYEKAGKKTYYGSWSKAKSITL